MARHSARVRSHASSPRSRSRSSSGRSPFARRCTSPGSSRSTARSSPSRSPVSTRSRRNDSARIVSIVLVVAGLTIIAYAGAVIVESIAGGVLSGALAERRRERTIEHLHDHFIICGYGRVGRRVAEEFRAAGRPLRRARLPRGRGRGGARRTACFCSRATRPATRTCAGRPRARAGARRRVRLGRRQPLRRPLGPLGASRPDDRRARLRRRRRAEARARRRGPRRASVHDRGAGDGEPRAQATGDRLPRRRDDRHRARPPARRDRGAQDVLRRPGGRSASSASGTRRARS